MKKTKRFTMIELLVVIGIIAILSSLLLPVLKSAKEMGKRSSCSNNMRQIYLGITYYATDWDDFMPASSEKWTSMIGDRIGLKRNTQLSYPDNTPWETSIKGILLCPSAASTAQSNPNNYPYLTSYSPTSLSKSHLYGADLPKKYCGMVKIIGSPGSYSGSVNDHKRMIRLDQEGVLMFEKKLYSHNALDMMTALNRSDGNKAYDTTLLDDNYGATYQHSRTANFMFGDGRVKIMKYGTRFGNITWETY